MRRFIIIAAIFLVVLGGAKLWYSNALKSTGAERKTVTIKDGEASSEIASDLKSKNLIKSPAAFKLHVRLNDLAGKFKAGRYGLSGDRTTPTVAKELTEGSKSATQLTIKEGLTQRQIADLLGGQDIVNQGEFAKLQAKDFPTYDFLQGLPENVTLEGFLFPETYTIPPPGTSTPKVAEIMLDQFDQELTPGMREQIKKNGRSLYDTVIVASMVEEEVRSDKDRKIVAGIIYKRLAENIRLDVDATTRYAVNKQPRDSLTAKDLDSDSPYNTRKLKGLPPGPIANPGLSALMAAIYPEESDNLFYLSAPDGTTYYATTNEEHEQNKEEHLK